MFTLQFQFPNTIKRSMSWEELKYLVFPLLA